MGLKVFSGGPVVKNLPCNAGDTGSIPDPRWSHMPWGNRPMCHNCQAYVLRLLKPSRPRTHSATREAAAMRNSYTAAREYPPPLAATRESSPASTKTQQAKNKWIKKAVWLTYIKSHILIMHNLIIFNICILTKNMYKNFMVTTIKSR